MSYQYAMCVTYGWVCGSIKGADTRCYIHTNSTKCPSNKYVCPSYFSLASNVTDVPRIWDAGQATTHDGWCSSYKATPLADGTVDYKFTSRQTNTEEPRLNLDGTYYKGGIITASRIRSILRHCQAQQCKWTGDISKLQDTIPAPQPGDIIKKDILIDICNRLREIGAVAAQPVVTVEGHDDRYGNKFNPGLTGSGYNPDVAAAYSNITFDSLPGASSDVIKDATFRKLEELIDNLKNYAPMPFCGCNEVCGVYQTSTCTCHTYRRACSAYCGTIYNPGDARNVKAITDQMNTAN